jgi:hypothetical protein
LHTGDAARNRDQAGGRVAGERAADCYTLVCDGPEIGRQRAGSALAFKKRQRRSTRDLGPQMRPQKTDPDFESAF